MDERTKIIERAHDLLASAEEMLARPRAEFDQFWQPPAVSAHMRAKERPESAAAQPRVADVAAQQRNAAAWNSWADRRINKISESFAAGVGKAIAKTRSEIRAESTAQTDALRTEIIELRSEISELRVQLEAIARPVRWVA